MYILNRRGRYRQYSSNRQRPRQFRKPIDPKVDNKNCSPSGRHFDRHRSEAGRLVIAAYQRQVAIAITTDLTQVASAIHTSMAVRVFHRLAELVAAAIADCRLTVATEITIVNDLSFDDWN